MRRIFCEECGKGKEPGVRMIYPPDVDGPAEFERVVTGIARQPTEKFRWMSVNGVKRTLPLDHWDCDTCSRAIHTGDRVIAQTVWVETQKEPPKWEHHYLIRFTSR